MFPRGPLNPPSFGSPAVRWMPDSWLCVPASRRVCLCREGVSAQTGVGANARPIGPVRKGPAEIARQVNTLHRSSGVRSAPGAASRANEPRPKTDSSFAKLTDCLTHQHCADRFGRNRVCWREVDQQREGHQPPTTRGGPPRMPGCLTSHGFQGAPGRSLASWPVDQPAIRHSRSSSGSFG